MSYKPSYLSYLNLLFLFLITAFLLFTYVKQPSKVVVVDSEKVFNDFKMTRETKKEGEFMLKKLNSSLDSLYVQLKFTDKEQVKSAITQQIIEQRQKLQNFNDQFISQETTKIWNRINSYTKDYGKLQGYPVIIGNQKNGNVFYIEEDKDRTVDLLNYMNKRYEGSN